MTQRSTRIKKLLMLARSKERLAGIELRRRRDSVQEQGYQLDQLSEYREEYTKRLNGDSEAGIDVAQLRNYRRFFGGLNDAIEQQGERLQFEQVHLDEDEAAWRNEYQRVDSLDKTVTRLEASEKTSQERISETLVGDDVTARKMSPDRSPGGKSDT